MNEKLMQVQQASEMIRSINGLNVLRNNVNSVLPNLNDNSLQHNLQGNTLGHYLATLNQYFAKQNQNSIYNQQHQMQQASLDNLIVQQHHLRQQLSNGQNNSNGNSPSSTQSLSDHDCNYINALNNLPQQLFCLQQQQKQFVVQQQLKNNLAKDDREILTNEEKQEALSKTFNSSEQNKFSNYDPKNCINSAQQLQITHHQQLIEKYSSSPLEQAGKIAISEDNKDFKQLELNKKIEMNKTNLETKFKNQNFQFNVTSPKSSSINKRLPIASGSTNAIAKAKEPDQNNNSPNKKSKLTSIIGVDEQGKPFHNYIGLIAQAILRSKERRLVLSEIYGYILENYPYYKTRNSGWRNSIRHNLSLNDCFVKGPRAANGKGHYWYIHPVNVRDFEKGDFSRRKAQRKVRKHLGFLDCRLNDEDQDSEDEEIKLQIYSRLNNFQQMNQHLSLQHSLHNLENNLYHLNSTSSLLANSNSTACPQINTIDTMNTIQNKDYLNYITFLRSNYLNNLNSSNTIMNNQNITENENLSLPYSNVLEKNQILEKKKDFPIKESNRKMVEDDDFVMVDVETDSSLNKTICTESENSLENSEILKAEIHQVNDNLINVNNDNVKNIEFCDDILKNSKKIKIDPDILERQSCLKLNDNFIKSHNNDTIKLENSERLDENSLQKNLQNNTQNDLLVNLGFLKQMMSDCNFTGENIIGKNTLNCKKQKFDMDSLLEKKDEKYLEASTMNIDYK